MPGTPDRIRTYDLWYRKPTLYPAELRARIGPNSDVVPAAGFGPTTPWFEAKYSNPLSYAGKYRIIVSDN